MLYISLDSEFCKDFKSAKILLSLNSASKIPGASKNCPKMFHNSRDIGYVLFLDDIYLFRLSTYIIYTCLYIEI